jgi:hypothetical protein
MRGVRAPVTVTFRPATGTPGARRRPGRSRGTRSPGARCGGDCVPAGAGVLTWWRRRARRASARKGRGRPPTPESASCPTFPRPALATSARRFAQSPDTLALRPSDPGQEPDGLARQRRALEAVEKVVTGILLGNLLGNFSVRHQRARHAQQAQVRLHAHTRLLPDHVGGTGTRSGSQDCRLRLMCDTAAPVDA